MPSDKEKHGTRCASQIVSEPDNEVCGVGVAHGARVTGLKVLAHENTDAIEAEAFLHAGQKIDVYSSSWG